MIKATFEESLSIIDKCLMLRRHKWTLAAAPWLDWDDVSQIIRLHIWKKWHLYKPELPLAHWVNRIISNQLTNLTRAIYSNVSRPCLSCAADEGLSTNGEGLCLIFGTQCNTCPIYAEWEKNKKPALNVKLPVTLEHHTQEVYDIPQDTINIPETVASITKRMPHVLKPLELKVYIFLYVDGLSEEQTARKLGYKAAEVKATGVGVVNGFKKEIMIKIRQAINDNEVEFNC